MKTVKEWKRRLRPSYAIVVKTLCGLSFLWLLGVAGASDQGLLTLGSAMLQGTIALSLSIIFAKLGGLLK